MFSRLDPFFKQNFRQAETTDTRQGIRREEKQDGRRRKDHKEKSKNSIDLWEDSTGVSVDALKAFLQNFLQTMPQESGGEKKSGRPAQPHKHIEPTNTVSARAMNAYETTAKHIGGYVETTPVIEEPKVSAPILTNQEIRTMHQLISDLNMLSKHGIQSLTIIRADSFLESLAKAVQLEKSKLHS